MKKQQQNWEEMQCAPHGRTTFSRDCFLRWDAFFDVTIAEDLLAHLVKYLDHEDQVKPLSTTTDHCIKFIVNTKAKHVHASTDWCSGPLRQSCYQNWYPTIAHRYLVHHWGSQNKETAVAPAEALGIAFLFWGARRETDATIAEWHLISPNLKCHRKYSMLCTLLKLTIVAAWNISNTLYVFFLYSTCGSVEGLIFVLLPFFYQHI